MGLQGYLPGFPSSYVCPAHFDMMSRDLCYLEGGTTKADQIAGSDRQKGNKRVWRVEWLVLLYSPPPPPRTMVMKGGSPGGRAGKGLLQAGADSVCTVYGWTLNKPEHWGKSNTAWFGIPRRGSKGCFGDGNLIFSTWQCSWAHVYFRFLHLFMYIAFQ